MVSRQIPARGESRRASGDGFDLTRTAHHFRLTDTGGRVEVTAKDTSDATSVAQIRSHLQRVAQEFAEGRFDAPFATHGDMPPGVTAMQARKRAIAYRYEEMKGVVAS